MSNRQLDNHLAHENLVDEIACCECGFHRNGQHHPKIRCPTTGRCGSCGNDWPCEEHAPQKSYSCPICGVKMENLAPGYWNCKRDGDFTERFLDKM